MIVDSRVRNGEYRDSIQLMQLQVGLERLPGVVAAVAMMATGENLGLLRADGWPLPADRLGDGDLYVGVRAETEERAEQAFAAVGELLRARRGGADSEYRPRTLDSAAKQLPEARWVSISTAGTHAVGLARRALELGKNVFLFSDGVGILDEVSLKAQARRLGLLVMGPDCGTAIVDGLGLGFANRVRRGPIGLVGSSGTGLQAVGCRIHALGEGVSHALGVGGRDLADEVGASSTLQALDLLRRDPETRALALVSKPPGPRTAALLTARLARFPKPVAACFLGHPAPARRLGSLRFAADLSELADLALELAQSAVEAPIGGADPNAWRATVPKPEGRRWLRGLFCGGTLASEALQRLGCSLGPIRSNLSSAASLPLPDPNRSLAHTVIDLGDDVFTRGRPHPMIDPEPLAARLEREADDPETAVIVFDVVLGDGAHPDPARRLAAAIAGRAGSGVQFLSLLVGTDLDPQDLESQRSQLEQAGAVVFQDPLRMMEEVEKGLGGVAAASYAEDSAAGGMEPPVALDALARPSVINLGLEAFFDSLRAQGATALHVDWKPPAGGDPDLAALLERMKRP